MHNHLVEFYESESLLVESVADFLIPAVEAGDSVICLATATHREAFVEDMQSRNAAVGTALREGRLVVLDAAEVLELFMDGSLPRADRFEQVIGGLVRSTGRGSPNMRIYGEMVAMLWEQGNRGAALQLENLWNALSHSRPFSLLCAYPLSSMEWGPDTAPFRGICSTHSGVRLRFDMPQAQAEPSSSMEWPAGMDQLQEFGSELDAVKEVISNANQMSRLAETRKTLRKSQTGGFDYTLNL